MFITTAISYLNGSPHIGHAYEILISDVLCRYSKLNKSNEEIVVFQAGVDEHGQKISDTAKLQNVEPIELCNKNLIHFLKIYNDLNINYDNFIRTTDKLHIQTVQHVFNKLKSNGDIYLGKYKGWYDTREEKFITNRQADLMKYVDTVTGKPLQQIEEDTYLFRTSKYQDRLLKLYKNNPNFISNIQFGNSILKRLEEPLDDLSISRTNLDWGINLGDGHVCYVWFDALLNYLSGIDYFGLSDNNQYKDIASELLVKTLYGFME